ncbi:MAG: phosphatase PAP2 family protein [bacterium]|nr:phosphatase PAP2 family protein [bacterium]
MQRSFWLATLAGALTSGPTTRPWASLSRRPQAWAPRGITRLLKESTNRARPNGKNDLSFPSTITAETAAWTALCRRNVAAMPIQKPYRMGVDVGFTALASLTGWSRVENGAHYPSDVLAGAPIGNFTSILIHDSFFGPSRRNFGMRVGPGDVVWMVGWGVPSSTSEAPTATPTTRPPWARSPAPVSATPAGGSRCCRPGSAAEWRRDRAPSPPSAARTSGLRR